MRTEVELTLTRRFAAERPLTIEHAMDILGPTAWSRNRSEPVRIREDSAERIPELLEHSIAVTVDRWLDGDETSRIAKAANGWWHQLSRPAPLEVIGAAYFAHAEISDDAYFNRASHAREKIDAAAPGVLERLLDWCSRVVGAEVSFRSGWAPPGIVMLDPARLGGIAGGIHFDWEGLASHPRASLTSPCYSFVSVLQAPESDAALRIWDLSYSPVDDATPRSGAALAQAGRRIEYRPGDLLMFDATTLHRIEPVSGTRLRMALTGHLAHMPEEGWQIWL